MALYIFWEIVPKALWKLRGPSFPALLHLLCDWSDAGSVIITADVPGPSLNTWKEPIYFRYSSSCQPCFVPANYANLIQTL